MTNGDYRSPPGWDSDGLTNITIFQSVLTSATVLIDGDFHISHVASSVNVFSFQHHNNTSMIFSGICRYTVDSTKPISNYLTLPQTLTEFTFNVVNPSVLRSLSAEILWTFMK